MSPDAVRKRIARVIESLPKAPAIAPRKPSTATTLAIIANHLGRIADAMEKRNQSPNDGVIEYYTEDDGGVR